MFPEREVWDLPATCSLDVADRGGDHTLDAIGELINVTRERSRQLEHRALVHARAIAKRMGVQLEELIPSVADRGRG